MSDDKMEYRTMLRFYADTPRGEKNKEFGWIIPSIVQWRPRLIYWIEKGFCIRAAFLEERETNTETGEVKTTNTRVEDSEIFSIIDEIQAKRVTLRR